VQAHVHGEDLTGAFDLRVRLHAPPDVRKLDGVHALTRQQAHGPRRKDPGNAYQQQADGDRG
jgi:hypothetical protein